jgi:membrane fusion protein (multidrug efflux system)
MNKTVPLLAAGAAALAVALVVWRHAAAAPEAAAPEAVQTALVRTVLAQRREMPAVVEAFGQVEPGATVSFAQAGQLRTLDHLAGDRVTRGERLAVLVPDPAAVQAWEQARSALALARREAARQRELLAAQLATQAQVDAADKAADDAQSALRTLQAQGGGAGETTLVAPFDGVVVALSATQGDRVAAGAPIAQVGRLDALRVRLAVEPADAARMRRGLPVQLFALAGGAALPTQVREVAGTVDAKTRLTDVLVDLPRAQAARLAPGMALRARVIVDAPRLVVVPRDAVLSDERGDYVFQVRAGKALRVAVERQLEFDGAAGISGLADLALPVVAVGNHELEDGMAVKVAVQ